MLAMFIARGRRNLRLFVVLSMTINAVTAARESNVVATTTDFTGSPVRDVHLTLWRNVWKADVDVPCRLLRVVQKNATRS